MSNYTKTSAYWLKKHRLSNERRFAKMRPAEKTRILQYYLKSSLRWLGGGSATFLVLAVCFQEIAFLFLSLGLLLVWSPLFFYHLRRKKKLRRYQNISSMQRMYPADFAEYVRNLYGRLGYALEEMPDRQDTTADGIGKDPQGNRIILQAQRRADLNTTSSPEIHAFIDSMDYHEVTHGIFVTTSYFTKPAMDAVAERRDLRIDLVDKDGLLALLAKIYTKK